MIVNMELKSFLKRNWDSLKNVFGFDDRDKPSSQSSFESKSSPLCHSSAYVYKTSESPLKKPKTNGFFLDDQKHGPLSSGQYPVPASRAPIHPPPRLSNSMSKSNNSTLANSKHNHRANRAILPFHPRGRSDLYEPQTTNIDTDRRLLNASTMAPSTRFPTAEHMNGFMEYDRLDRTVNDRAMNNDSVDIGRLSAFAASKPKPGSGFPWSSKSSNMDFSHFMKTNPTTALGKLKNSQQSVPLNLVAPRTSTAQKESAGLVLSRLESSFSNDLRRRIQRHGTTFDKGASTFSAPKNGLKTTGISKEPKSLPDVYVIEDSDEENRVLPKTLIRNTRNFDWDTEKKRRDARIQHTLGMKPISQQVEDTEPAEQYYEEIYRSVHAVSEERQKRILADLEKCVKSIAVDDVDLIPLSSEANDAINRAFSSGRTDEVLTEAFRVKMTRKDFATLKGLNWLNDEIANFFLEMIMDRSTRHQDFPKVHAFNTFFYTQLMNKGYASLKRWTKKIDLLSHDIILVPVHLSSHWCLAVINLRKKQMRYYDSLGHNNEQCFRLLRTYLEEEKKDKGSNYPHWSNISLDWEEWDFISVAEEEGIPQQQNMCDCGVFMLKFADFVSRDKAVDFTQENMPYFRRRICWEILQNKLMGS